MLQFCSIMDSILCSVVRGVLDTDNAQQLTLPSSSRPSDVLRVLRYCCLCVFVMSSAVDTQLDDKLDDDVRMWICIPLNKKQCQSY